MSGMAGVVLCVEVNISVVVNFAWEILVNLRGYAMFYWSTASVA
jgi:hypothetical protein